jgi:hypothetical protein
MQEIVEVATKQSEAKRWNRVLMEDLIMVTTPVGVKSLSLGDALGFESSIENTLRIHLVHSLKKKL